MSNHPTVGAVDLIESATTPLAPVGVTRIARQGGALMSSTDGGAYTSLGSGGGATVQTDGTSIQGDGSSGNKIAIKAPVSVANGGTASTDANTAINTLCTLLTTQAVSIVSPDGGTISKVLKLQATGASADPALSLVTGAGAGTEQGYIRAATDGVLTVVPRVAGALTGPGESQVLMTWTGNTLGFFGVTRVARQAVGNALTDGTSGGTAGTLTTFAGSTYATDAPIILGDLHQLAIKVAALETALKNLGLCSS